jgi:hypothetical protein
MTMANLIVELVVKRFRPRPAGAVIFRTRFYMELRYSRNSSSLDINYFGKLLTVGATLSERIFQEHVESKFRGDSSIVHLSPNIKLLMKLCFLFAFSISLYFQPGRDRSSSFFCISARFRRRSALWASNKAMWSSTDISALASFF